jgi:F0F1-type ATP synthase assembly protein I
VPKKIRADRNYRRDPLQIGGTIVGVTVVFGGAGWWLDSLIGTFPFGLMIGSVIGLFGVMYLNFLWLKEMDRQESQAKQNTGNGTPPTDS